MQLFLDQMFRVELGKQLGTLGYDVIRASEVGLSRADDADILARAIATNRLLVTLDGLLATGRSCPCGRIQELSV